MIEFRDKDTGKKVSYNNIDRIICQLIDHEYDEDLFCYLTNEHIIGLDWFNDIAMNMCNDSLQTIERNIIHKYCGSCLGELIFNINKIYSYLNNNYTYYEA